MITREQAQKETRILREYIADKLGISVREYSERTGYPHRTLNNHWNSYQHRPQIMTSVFMMWSAGRGDGSVSEFDGL